jgi:ATP-binding cassette subfamily D (ALD) long-chain fatty acid import protein
MVDGKKKVSVSDPLFYVRLKKLIRIVIPSIRSREAAMLALHSAFLLLRTGISLYVADLDGRWAKKQRTLSWSQNRFDISDESTSFVFSQSGEMASDRYPGYIYQLDARIPTKRTRSGIPYTASLKSKGPNVQYSHWYSRLTKHALKQYLDPAREAFLGMDEKGLGMDDKGQQLFYKLANLDDRIKNADQVRATSKWRLNLVLDSGHTAVQ